LSDYEPIAAVLETWSTFNNNRLANGERMLAATIRPKTVIRNVSALSSFAPLRLVIVSIILTCRLLLLLAAPVVFLFVLLGLPIGLPVFFVLVDAFIVLLLLFVTGPPVRLRTLLLLRMRLVLLRIYGRGNSQKYSQCGYAENCN
jgi:hypothetical protein